MKQFVKLFVLALIAALMTALAGNALVDIVMGKPLRLLPPVGFIDTPHVLIGHVGLSALPFLPLVLLGEKRWPFWLGAAALAMANYVYGAWQTHRDSLNDFAGGANIGMGIIMMGVPMISAAIMLVLALLSKKRNARS